MRGMTARTKWAVLALAMLSAVALAAWATRTPRYRMESMWYMLGGEGSYQLFIRNVDRITIAAPHAFFMDENGTVRGRVDPRVLRAAREHRVRVLPLVSQPRFDRPTFHRFLHDPGARARAARTMAALCAQNQFWGLQFDFEHIHVDDKAEFTAFFRETANALHSVGCVASVAVVPRTSHTGGGSPYGRWMHDLWRGAYDYRALAEAADFVTLMAYDQHTRYTPPGPIAGIDWVERAVQYILADGVPAGKIMLGVPMYSRVWSAVPTPPGGGPAASGGLKATGLTHGEARARLDEHRAEPRWEGRSKSYSASWQNEGVNEHLALENARTFRSRLALVRRYRLRGFSAWRLGHEDPDVWFRLRFQAMRER